MNVTIATKKNIDDIHKIVHATINLIYPLYYPTDVVQFFLTHHSKENIAIATRKEFILLLEEDGQLIGTGSIVENEIKRMFILADYQNNGHGSLLLNMLEQKAIEAGYSTVELDSSLPAYGLYERKGYKPIKNEKIVAQNGQVLFYNRMSKRVNSSDFKINYNDKVFATRVNSDNGEVSTKTMFRYQQQNDIVWAEYSGGEIIRGYLLGTTNKEGHLEFSYQHINIRKEFRTGTCKSKPQILPDGRVQLNEEWIWTNGDISRGSSTIEEIKQ